MAAPVPTHSLRDDYEMLLRQHSVEVQLAEALGSGGRLGELFFAVAQLSGRPVWLLNAAGATVMSAGVPDGMAAPQLAAPDLPPPAPQATDPGLSLVQSLSPQGIRRRLLVGEILNDTRCTGRLVIAEYPSPFGPFDRYLAGRAAVYLSRHHRLHKAVRESIADLGSELADQLLKGAHRSGTVRQDAELLGIDLDADKVVVCLDDAAVDDGIGSGAAFAHRIAGRTGTDVIGTRTPNGIALIASAGRAVGQGHSEVVNRLKQSVLSAVPPEGVQAGISSIRPADQLTDAYAEATEVLSCLERFSAEQSRVVTARDLGPARVLVANGNIGSIRRYVRHTLGPLWDGAPEDQALLATLAAFVRSGHNVRRTAALLDVHENTVRLRITKVRKLTGLDVLTDPADQLAVHTALAIVTLRDRPHPVAGVADGAGRPAEVSGRTA